ncbi:MAG: hypothetical protein PVF54_08345 [Anaerolineae bacterium]
MRIAGRSEDHRGDVTYPVFIELLWGTQELGLGDACGGGDQHEVMLAQRSGPSPPCHNAATPFVVGLIRRTWKEGTAGQSFLRSGASPFF